ncbi:MAG: PPIC-type PPIASE domain protein [Candidatus Moranbacteria bacterium GW2011_GWE1_36_7]|nr:MAG: PPIC-type PPIASE domain protein [Candidatus Moranbacteria bacterium GW2011_GWD2_36_12]KKQ06090.1 MAG: PPIC-type PPIASE domain protein [Candidatus Moranbacteria bacterium GW2011_GWE2_36_40]KKQ14966.1 MAG: PPIC-type PPIASE domain protein [Candidatus Moranbacteria bacterium GW2011_GWE1_36_7]
MDGQKKQNKNGEKLIKVSTLIYSILIALIIIIGIASILAYGTSTEIGAKISAKISRVVPFPAAIVGWRSVVFMNDVEANLATVEKFYKTQNFASEGLRVDFTTEEGKKRLRIKQREILDKLVEDRIIEILAKKYGVSVSEADAQKVISLKLNEFGTIDDVKSDLQNSYGWDIDDFKQRVVVPSLYADALAVKVAEKNSSTEDAKKRIEMAQREIAGGKEFSQVVRTHSEGASKDRGGELGWVTKEQILPELQKALFESSDFKKSSIVESTIGFHLIEIENSKEENGVKQLKLRQIFVSKNTFSQWLENEKKQMKVIVPLKDFVWNKDSGSIDFRDEEMRVFEKEQRSKLQGDASIMF